mgnify:FL=1
MKTLPKISLLAFAYLLMFPLGSVTGLIHPACYAYVGALMPLLFALVYLPTAATLRSFGAATVLNGFLSVVWLLIGEADTTFVVGIVVLTAASEIVRWRCGYDTLRGIRLSFIPFALSFFAYTGHWWTNTEGSLAEAVEDMRPGYDALMKTVIDNTAMIVVVVLLTIPIAIVAMRLAERAMKKQVKELE